MSSGPPKSVSSDSPQLLEYMSISFILWVKDLASISDEVPPLLFLIPLFQLKEKHESIIINVSIQVINHWVLCTQNVLRTQ